MGPDTRSALAAINRRFYDRFAADFDASRQHPWPGWQRVTDRLHTDARTPTVLDVGCGNGRLGTFLAGRSAGGCRYFGLDGCEALLRAAANRLDGRIDAPELRRVDVLADDLDQALGEHRFDFIALFGVLHHVPGTNARRALLQRLGRRLAPGGILAASIWRLDRTPSFARRQVPWEAFNRTRRRRSQPPIDLEELEPGDTLLSWGGDSQHPRYCHFPDALETESLATAAELPLADRFEADGPTDRDNLYLVWQHHP